MAIGNGMNTYSYNTLKSMKKEELINVIRCLESNLIKANTTLDIQADNCKKLLVKERNNAIDDFKNELYEKAHFEPFSMRFEIDQSDLIKIVEQLKGDCNDD